MRTFALAAFGAVTLAGCVSYNVRETPGFVRLGETAMVSPARVTPIEVLEDSRCPAGVQCVWAGRVRIAARVNAERREMTLGEPTAAGGGRLVLSEVRPENRADPAIGPTDYRFRFEFR